ncbi:TetR/AcrR family transcriptional regulator [Sneathiella sp.]|uniref:TetR/AcrR family transcriptional regulator n=1 Tax=Sneathiella sp. TaxID=1964365 RepID=UPI0039E2A10B
MSNRKVPLQSRSKERVEKIISCAETLLKTTELSKVTTSRIAEEAAVPVGSIYQYFKDRDEILLALGEQILERENNILTTTFEELAPKAHWRRLVTALLEIFSNLVAGDEIRYRLDIALSGHDEWQLANLASENQMVHLFAGYPRFAEIGYSRKQAEAVARASIICVKAMILRRPPHYPLGYSTDLALEAEKVAIAYLASIFGD